MVTLNFGKLCWQAVAVKNRQTPLSDNINCAQTSIDEVDEIRNQFFSKKGDMACRKEKR